MKIKNRIIGSGEEVLDQIMFNPRNWRIHPMGQQNALKGVLEEIGWVQQVIVNKRTGNLVDGHLRCQLAMREGNKSIPVLYVDISEEEEMTVLATLDPIGSMAVTDREKMKELMNSMEEESTQIDELISEIAENNMLAEMGGFERPTYDNTEFVERLGGEVGKSLKNERYYYIEYYKNEERWNELNKMLAGNFVGQSFHEVNADLFYEMVKAYVSKNNK